MNTLSETMENIQKIALKYKEIAPKADYKCWACRDIGQVIVEQLDGQPIITICECQKKEILKSKWINSGFNIMSKTHSLNNFELRNEASRKIKNMAVEYVKEYEHIQFLKNHSIAFLGEPGSGKTHICMAIALELIKKGFSPIYFPYRDVIMEIKQSITEANDYKIIMNKYKKAKILIIDDLFKGGANESDIRIMFEILNYRYLNNLSLVISSENLSQELIKIDKAIGSRIIEMCKGRTLDILGEQYNQRLG